jgi:hypothetical protein
VTITRSPRRLGENAVTRPARSRTWHATTTAKESSMIASLLIAIVVFLIFTFPATWLLMLFLGNLHLGLSYWGTLPLGILVSVQLGAVASRANAARLETI